MKNKFIKYFENYGTDEPLENEIQSAEEFAKKYTRWYCQTGELMGDMVISTDDCYEAMIEFAKFHVKAALEAAVEKADAGCDFGNMRASNGDLYATYAGHIGKVIIIKDSILSAYPEELIK